MKKINSRKEEVVNFFDEFAPEYNKVRFSSKKQKIISKIAINTVAELAGKTDNKKILDAGCGSGRYTIHFTNKHANVFSVDSSEKMLKILKVESNNSKPIAGDIFNLPFKNDSFDLIISSQVLTHLHEYEKPLIEFKRILNSHGYIIIDLRNSLYPISYLRNMYPKYEIDKDPKYNPNLISIFKIERICNKLNLEIEEFRGVGLSGLNIFLNKESERRIKIEKSISNTILRYFAPTLILKIKKLNTN